MTQQARQMEQSLEKVRAFFAPGTIGGKCREIEALRAAGDTMFFDGAVRWRVLVTDNDLAVKGVSESLDAAFLDMLNSLHFLLKTHDADAPVSCAAELAGGEEK
jgi:hypothetical protein